MQYAAGSPIDRILGVIRFDAPTLRRLEHDASSLPQAAVVVSLVSLAVAIGSVDDTGVKLPLFLIVGAMLWAMRSTRMPSLGSLSNRQRNGLDLREAYQQSVRRIEKTVPLPGVLVVTFAAIAVLSITLHLPAILIPVIVWITFSGIAVFVGQYLVGTPITQASFLPMLAGVGFALAPVTLAMVSIVPVLGNLVFALAIVWTLLLLTFVISQTLSFSIGRAALTCAVAWIGAIAVAATMVSIF